MASRRTLAHHLLCLLPRASHTPPPHGPPNPSFARRFLRHSHPSGSSRHPGRFLHNNGRFSSEHLPLPSGDRLMERLRALNGSRLRLDILSPPPLPDAKPELAEEEEKLGFPLISVADVKKVLKVSQMEAVKARLRAVRASSISYSEFVEICRRGSGHDHGLEIAKALDESGEVIVLGNIVFLQPQKVARAIGSMVLPKKREEEEEREELEKMERAKAEIDLEAEAGARREMWCGLAFLSAQTAGFMRLTFWELSWDVMEPVCFFVTSLYFIAGYAFFLRTDRDPSFEGFFGARLQARQRRLMRAAGFDADRFDELRRAFRSSARWSLGRGVDACLRGDSALFGEVH